MKKIINKIMGILSILIVIFSIVGTAYASSYSTSYRFSVAVTGATRYFNGSNITFTSPYASSTPFKSRFFTYNIALYRDRIIDDYIGSVTLYRDQSGTANWNNVGAGNYYFILSKVNDGVTLVDKKVTIKN